MLIKVDNGPAGINAVRPALFLGGAGTAPPPPPPPPPPTIDLPGVQGSWVGTYGVDGYVLGDWNARSSDLVEPAGRRDLQPRAGGALQLGDLADDRRPRPPEPGPDRATGDDLVRHDEVRVRLNFTNAYSGTLHLYAVDWDAIGRARERHRRRRDRPADGRPRRAFNAGAWVHVPITVAAGGSVVIKVDRTAPAANAVLSALFLGGAGTPPPPPPPPPPPTIDCPASRATGSAPTASTATSSATGTAERRPVSLPAGVTYSLEQGTRYSWTIRATTDVRALESPDQTERRATDLVRRERDAASDSTSPTPTAGTSTSTPSTGTRSAAPRT